MHTELVPLQAVSKPRFRSTDLRVLFPFAMIQAAGIHRDLTSQTRTEAFPFLVLLETIHENAIHCCDSCNTKSIPMVQSISSPIATRPDVGAEECLSNSQSSFRRSDLRKVKGISRFFRIASDYWFLILELTLLFLRQVVKVCYVGRGLGNCKEPSNSNKM